MTINKIINKKKENEDGKFNIILIGIFILLYILLANKLADILSNSIVDENEKLEIVPISVPELTNTEEEDEEQDKEKKSCTSEDIENIKTEINSLKDTVLKLQTYTMDVNKVLLQERINILSDLGDNGERFMLQQDDNSEDNKEVNADVNTNEEN